MTDNHNTTDRTDDKTEHREKEPINEVRFASGRVLIVEECVICGDSHTHGAKGPAIARGEPAHRAAHCGTSDSGGYYIRLADDADPPPGYFRRELGAGHDPAVRAPCGGGEA